MVPHAVAPRVDVIIDGKPFTSYIFERSQKKPSLYPLRTAKGTIVTRGYPLDPHPGERADHPHHVGLWFNYGDVNGLDFWNNSDAITGERAARMGTVVHQRVIEAVSGKDKGELNVEMDWVDVKGTVLLKENTRYVFQGDGNTRVVDRITRLAALKDPVVLGDNKEGAAGHPHGARARTAVEVRRRVSRRQQQASGQEPSTTKGSPATTSAATARPATPSGARAGPG